MTIHPSIASKADKLGLIGREINANNPPAMKLAGIPPVGTVQFHWPVHNVYAFGVGAKAAMAEAEAIMAIKRMDDNWRVVNVARDPFLIELFNSDRSLVFIRGGATPQDTLAELNGDKGDRQWLTTTVPTDGAEAFKQGFTAADNPWIEDEDEPTEAQTEWDEAFDAAADAQSEADEADEGPTGSVVKQEYRLRYAEAGHPNHCGDWLAETLNNLILGKTHTELDKFEDLCNANSVSLAKYKREGNGWEGRLRMTGRNLLASRIFVTGSLAIPPSLVDRTDGQTVLPVPAEWVASRPYKNKKPATVAPATPPEPDDTLNNEIAAVPPEVTMVEAAPDAPIAVPSVQEQLARRKASSKNKK